MERNSTAAGTNSPTPIELKAGNRPANRQPNPTALIAIASYGTAQDHYLKRVLAEYRELPMPVQLVVLSNVMKPVQGVEVIAGLPSPNPYSLPFAHRRVFAERANDYDLFIYTEDDTLITGKHIQAFLSAQSKLAEDEIPGFIRSEADPRGRKYITSINHHFRWLPNSVVARGGGLFAQFSNQHSGCFMVTRQQLLKAIASGRFLVPPHAEVYGMLETAASDIYTQCGLRRLICLDRIHDFIIPHLPNKYYMHLGVPIEVLDAQVAALREMRGNNWAGELFEPQCRAPGFRWSKMLYERPDELLLTAIPESAKRVLVVGSGWGENEAWLDRCGFKVCAIPVDVVFGALVRRRGIRTVDGPLDHAVEALNGQRFDAVVLPDVLHLLPDPPAWLQKLRCLLEPDGRLIASVANTGEIVARVKDWRDGRRFEVNGEQVTLQKVNTKRLRDWCRSTGFTGVKISPVVSGKRRALRRWGLKALEPLFASRFILTAKRGSVSG
jgi:2-polyprenyl-3-methyl-5-hydroxy-6-metoxy-1,4-benzoquinol methylase